MSLAISLFPDIDGLDGLISESELVLQIWLAVLALLVAFVVVGKCVERVKRQSPVERILKQGLLHRATAQASTPIGQAAAEDASS